MCLLVKNSDLDLGQPSVAGPVIGIVRMDRPRLTTYSEGNRLRYAKQ